MGGSSWAFMRCRRLAGSVVEMKMRSLRTCWYHGCAIPSSFLPYGRSVYPWVFLGWPWQFAEPHGLSSAVERWEADDLLV